MGPPSASCDGGASAASASTAPGGARWKLLFRQTAGTYKRPVSKWARVNPDDPESPNYSILDTLGDVHKFAHGVDGYCVDREWVNGHGQKCNSKPGGAQTRPVQSKTCVPLFAARTLKCQR